MPKPQAIFIHSSWRSGSTWFWHKFRQCPEVYAYYEPLHETLAGMTKDNYLYHKPTNWDSNHPAMAPYFSEYGPLIQPSGGIRHFRPEFTLASYYGRHRNPAIMPHLQRYISGLLTHAHQQDKIPVLGFCRSMGRVRWLKQQFPQALHLVTLRNPWELWVSSLKQSQIYADPYFLYRPYLIASLNRWWPDLWSVFAGLDLVPVLSLLRQRRGERENFYRRHFAALDQAARCRLFLRIAMLDVYRALPHADLVVDLSPARDVSYRQQIEQQLRQRTGLSQLDFSDYAMPRYGWADGGDEGLKTLAPAELAVFPPRLRWMDSPGKDAAEHYLQQALAEIN